MADANQEHGAALTLAYFFSPPDGRPARRLIGERERRREITAELSFGLRF